MTARCSTWLEWDKFFRFQSHRLLNFEAKDVFYRVNDYLEFKSFVIRLQQQHFAMVERAIRKFSVNNRWPPLNPCQKYFLKRRLEFAKRCCVAARSKASIPLTNMPEPDAGSAPILKAILIDGWQHDGVSMWQCSLHDQWLQVMAGNVSQQEWSDLVQQLQNRRIVCLINHVRKETPVDDLGDTIKHLDYYVQCADGSRWKGSGVGFFPTEVENVQQVFNNCPEDFEPLPAPPTVSS